MISGSEANLAKTVELSRTRLPINNIKLFILHLLPLIDSNLTKFQIRFLSEFQKAFNQSICFQLWITWSKKVLRYLENNLSEQPVFEPCFQYQGKAVCHFTWKGSDLDCSIMIPRMHCMFVQVCIQFGALNSSLMSRESDPQMIHQTRAQKTIMCRHNQEPSYEHRTAKISFVDKPVHAAHPAEMRLNWLNSMDHTGPVWAPNDSLNEDTVR